MTRTHFETLRVYQLSETLADTIWRIVEKWRPFPRDTVGKQIVRAADSIGANIAEGTGKGMLPDHRRYVRVARRIAVRNKALASPGIYPKAADGGASRIPKDDAG